MADHRGVMDYYEESEARYRRLIREDAEYRQRLEKLAMATAAKPGNSGTVTLVAGTQSIVAPPSSPSVAPEEKTVTTGQTNPPAPLSTKPTVLERAKVSMQEGGKLAVANEAGEIALEAMIALVPQLKELCVTPFGRSLAKGISALAMSFAANATDFEMATKVQDICDEVITVSTLEAVQDKLKLLRPVLLRLVELSKQLAPPVQVPVPTTSDL